MMNTLTTDVSMIVFDPTAEDVREIFQKTPHVADKILRHLDPATGSVEHGVTQCVGIATLDHNPFYVQVIYRTKRPNGKDGSHFMRFYLFTAAMRCLPLTGDGRVVMIQEYRRSRGEWVQMLPAGASRPARRAKPW